MAKIADIPILGEGHSPQPGGAAFLLTSRPKTNEIVSIEGGQVEIRNGTAYAVARLNVITDPATAFSEGHALVQRGLDMMSILGRHDGVLRDAEDEHLLWWTEETGIVLRSVSTSVISFFTPPITLTHRDSTGALVPISTPPVAAHHVAFRFFRLAQATDDLFDAYRNMYLAFETLLSTRYAKSRSEQESAWLKRGLDDASESLRLPSLVSAPPATAVEEFITRVYRNARLPLFHAKTGRTYFPPYDNPEERRVVSEALALLTQVVLRMTEVWLGIRRPGGGVFFGWVYANMIKFASDCIAFASSYDGVFDAAEKDLTHPRFAAAVRLECRLAPEFQRGKEPAILSTGRGVDLTGAGPLRRVELALGEPFSVLILEDAIDLSGVTRFEDLRHMRARNSNQPRSAYRQ